ncbi:MAG: hypothetical protein KC594_18505, partial [Nitrospira sp.]|nr:hypothetical protein [Nitrospira sp.]
WSDRYGQHLDKWLITETFTICKTLVMYEEVATDVQAAFSKIASHLGITLNVDHLTAAYQRCTKNEVNHKTNHDPQVISKVQAYEEKRALFQAHHSDNVWRDVCQGRPELQRWLLAQYKQLR